MFRTYSVFPIRRFSTFCPPNKKPGLSLYLVADPHTVKDDRQFFSKILESIKGGVTCIQLRDLKNDLPTILKTAKTLKKILQDTRTPLFINTNHLIQVADTVKADGVYLEKEISISEVRKQLGKKMIVGAPLKTIEELDQEENQEIDYLSVKIFQSKKTNPNSDFLFGIEGLQKIRSISNHQIVAIGGLHLGNVKVIYQKLHPFDGVALVGGLLNEKDPLTTALKIQMIREQVLEGKTS